MNNESVDLIYLDPPFNSKRFYSAPIGSKAAGASFKDMWTWDDVDKQCLQGLIESDDRIVEFIRSIGSLHGKPMMAYITYMTQRLVQMHRVLKPTGSLYLHCDPTASHYLKLVLDAVFGKDNFRNEIVWAYSGPSNTSRWFPRKHDIVFFYAKTEKAVFNRDAVRIAYKRMSGTGKSSYASKGRTSDELRAMELAYTKRGKVPEDYWTDVGAGSHMPKTERIGYPTQKPLALLYRIINASSNKDDVVFDPFCGCATTCVAAQQLGRKWIGIDIEEKAAELVVSRLSDDAGLFSNFIHRFDLPKRTDVEQVETTDNNIKVILYKGQRGKCKGCESKLDIRHLEIDHVIPRSKGGGNYQGNYQLLCGNCNRIKGDRPMEFLNLIIANRHTHLTQRITFGT